jgi:hypothetical protein
MITICLKATIHIVADAVVQNISAKTATLGNVAFGGVEHIVLLHIKK